jgi:hypothetical protein
MANDKRSRIKETNSDENERAQQIRKEIEKLEGKGNITRQKDPVLKREQREIYKEALRALNESGIDYAVGAAFARHAYTSIWRPTKDLDLFVRPQDLRTMMDVLEEIGFETEVNNFSWLSKAWKGGFFIDMIFGTGNGHLPIDDRSFDGAKKGKVLGLTVKLMPIEEMIATSMYVAGRNRFDGGEVVHLIRASKGKIDWGRILERMGENRALVLWHLLFFDFIYPGHSNYLPQDLMIQLFEEAKQHWEAEKKQHSRAFRGTLLDPYSYTVDVKDWGYEDRRNKDPLVNKEGKYIG